METESRRELPVIGGVRVDGPSVAGSGPGDRLLYLMNDFVVQEHVCNLRCTYCLNFENENLKDGEPWKPTERIDLKAETYGWRRARRMLDLCRQRGDAPILRLAGGEIMAIGGALDFLEEIAGEWERVQVLTNATFLRKDIDRLARWPTLNLCCSVDGHTAELNALRTPRENWAERIVDGLLAAVEAGIPVEVYTVLTHHNTHAIHEFARYLLDLDRSADVRLLPFPVRGEVARTMAPKASQVEAVERLLDDYETLAEILPPRGYVERLVEICGSGVRRHRCRVPLSFLQTFDDGVVASCSNCWASPLGNLLEEDRVLEQVGEATIHKLFLRDPPRFPFCRGCFTPFDVVNVFLDGDCTLDEITAMDLYSSPAARRRLVELASAFEEGGKRPLWRRMPEERLP